MIRRLFADKALHLAPEEMPRLLSLLDVGARDGVQWPWDSVTPGLTETILVEPDPTEAASLRKKFATAKSGVVLPVALSSETGTRVLYLNRNAATSSLFRANRIFLDQFPEVDRFDVQATLEVSTRTIDDMVSKGEMPQVDFAKIDVQGAELDVLKGGVRHLSANLVGLEIEVEFAEEYSGQPMFADVDSFVREELGLELWDVQKTYWKYEHGRDVPGSTKGRLVHGNVLYLRSLSGIERWISTMPQAAASEKIVMLIITALAFGYGDYAMAILRAPSLAGVLDATMREPLQRAIFRGSGLRPFRDGNNLLFQFFESMAMAFKPTHRGWASIGQPLGSRRRGPFWR